jgi:hypothetical protein
VLETYRLELLTCPLRMRQVVAHNLLRLHSEI